MPGRPFAQNDAGLPGPRSAGSRQGAARGQRPGMPLAVGAGPGCVVPCSEKARRAFVANGTDRDRAGRGARWSQDHRLAQRPGKELTPMRKTYVKPKLHKVGRLKDITLGVATGP